MDDLRDEIFRRLSGRIADAFIIANGAGVIAGTQKAKDEGEHLGLAVKEILPEGSHVNENDVVAHFRGHVKEVAIGEDFLIGYISKPSGIATAAYKFRQAAGDRPRVVSGAWKKMPLELKETIRKAVVAGGAFIRISSDPFIYLDKNYIEIFGGIAESLKAVAHLKGYLKVIQLRGRYEDIALEAREAAKLDADILFIDTGDMDDIDKVAREIRKMGLREKVEIAFGGAVTLAEMDIIKTLDVDILDIGRAIVDAPLLDLKYEVQRI